MNFLRSKFAAYKEQNSSQPTKSISMSNQPKHKVFQQLKKWDKQRAQILKRHLQVIEQILGNLQIRVKNSQQYILSIEGIFKARLKELETYKSNSLNNSTFVLMNTQMPGYQESYDLLKELVMFEAQNDDKVAKKYQELKSIFAQLYDFQNHQSQREVNLSQQASNSPSKKDKSSQKKNSLGDDGEENEDLDQSSVVMLKSNVRYLIDCQLPDIIEQASKLVQQINKTYHSQSSHPSSDLYILLTKFLHATKRQVQKHRQIGKQLLNLNKDLKEREKKRSVKVKSILSEWVKVDENANEVLIRQLEKQGNQSLIDDYYSLDDLFQNDGTPLKQHQTIEQYLLHVSIRPFQHAIDLLLFHSDAFYNRKIQTQILITSDHYCHLRKPNQFNPEFSFLLTKQIYINQEEEFVFKIEKLEKKFLKSIEKEFQFVLEFNVVEDIQKFVEVFQDIKQVHLKCL